MEPEPIECPVHTFRWDEPSQDWMVTMFQSERPTGAAEYELCNHVDLMRIRGDVLLHFVRKLAAGQGISQEILQRITREWEEAR